MARPAALLQRRQRLDVLGQREQLFFAHLPLEGRHDGREARDDLRRGVENRFADVGRVGRHRVAVRQLRRVEPNTPFSSGPRPCESRAVARDAGELREQLLAALRERAFRRAPPSQAS